MQWAQETIEERTVVHCTNVKATRSFPALNLCRCNGGACRSEATLYTMSNSSQLHACLGAPNSLSWLAHTCTLTSTTLTVQYWYTACLSYRGRWMIACCKAIKYGMLQGYQIWHAAGLSNTACCRAIKYGRNNMNSAKLVWAWMPSYSHKIS